MSTDNHCTKWR